MNTFEHAVARESIAGVFFGCSTGRSMGNVIFRTTQNHASIKAETPNET